jgi:hypothetical protein
MNIRILPEAEHDLEIPNTAMNGSGRPPTFPLTLPQGNDETRWKMAKHEIPKLEGSPRRE